MTKNKLHTFDEFITEGKTPEIPFDKGTKVILKRDISYNNRKMKNVTFPKGSKAVIDKHDEGDYYWVEIYGPHLTDNVITRLKYGKDF